MLIKRYFQFTIILELKTDKKVLLLLVKHAYIYFLSEQFSIFRETNNASKY